MSVTMRPSPAMLTTLITSAVLSQSEASDNIGIEELTDIEVRESPIDILTQLIGSLTNSIGIGEFIKVSDSKGSKKNKRIDDSDDDYKVVHTNSVYPQCSGKLESVCRHSNEQIMCGTSLRQARIVNGKQTSAGSYPWTVGIQFGDKLYCGGAIVSHIFVVTAAHCVKGINTRHIKLVIGDHDRRKQEPFQEIRTIDKVFIRPDFVKRTFNNDIALVKLNREVVFNDYIRPVCLPGVDRSYNGHNTTVVGWGKLSEGGKPADILMEVTVPVIKQMKCRKQTRYRTSEITENMMCAGYDDGVLDACQGDSGGPMIWRHDADHPYTQIGIVSWGQGCARKGYPGVYTRIGRYIDWIIETVSANDSCFCQKK